MSSIEICFLRAFGVGFEFCLLTLLLSVVELFICILVIITVLYTVPIISKINITLATAMIVMISIERKVSGFDGS